ncbi:hypothetical protein [Povalibacter sp.]|uniref:hypothetical protein n=1 Tax=Povalibacter sp. TaxID=1962978 RepID=UPI002F3F8539
MKTRIAFVGTGMLLTLGSAVAGSVMFAQGKGDVAAPVAVVAQQTVSAETIAMWKATSASTDYIAPRVPL